MSETAPDKTKSDAKRPVPRKMTRRGFLILLGTGAVGLYLGVRFTTPLLRLRLTEWVEESGGPPSRVEGPPDAWFDISPENKVTLYLPKSEMGQGIHTALAQIAAEELDLDWEQLTVTHAGTGMGLDDPVGTSASTSVSALYRPLREAAATLRELLLAEAARQLSVPQVDLVAENGIIRHKADTSKHLTYGQLFQQAPNWELPKEPPALRPESSFKVIGKPLARVDLPDKVRGKAVYGFDVRLPDMLYGAVARPQTIEGKLRSAKPGNAPDQPGVVKVVIEDGFAGVVAESRVQAYAALGVLELEWDEGKPWQQEEIDALVQVGRSEGVTIQKEGDADGVLRGGTVIEAEYRSPMALHAYQEPLAAVADAQEGEVKVWASTQAAVRLRGKIADALKRDETTVIVTPVYLGGGFGRKIDEQVAVDAARLSNAVGRPVHVGLFRPQDFRNGFLRPPTHHKLRARLDESGRVLAFEHQQASGEVAFPFLPRAMGVVMGADFGSWRGALIPYAGIANLQTVASLAQLPVKTGWWRGLGLFANIFALESFMDELAHAAQIDPMEFRLQHLGEDETGQRLKAVLQAAAERVGWGTPAPEGRARGIACCTDARTMIAEVAEVSIINGRVRVHRVTAAVDPGLVINPDGVEAQVQGAITMGISATLVEAATVKDGKLAANFDSYPLLRNADAPDIEVVQVPSGAAPSGMGEPPIGPIGAAVANAIFALTGKRIRTLPMKL